MEKRDSWRKLPSYSICSLKNLVGLILQSFEVTVWKITAVFVGVFIAAVEDIVQADIFLYDIDIVHGSMIGKLARGGGDAGKHSNNIRLIPYSSHLFYIFNVNTPFKTYGYPSCDQFIKTVQHVELQLTTCSGRYEHIFTKTCVSCEKHHSTN